MVQLNISLYTPTSDHFPENSKSIYCAIHKIAFVWKFRIFHSLSSRSVSRDLLCLEGPYQQNIILFQYIQYVFCYPLTENIHYKQRKLYILRVSFFNV